MLERWDTPTRALSRANGVDAARPIPCDLPLTNAISHGRPRFMLARQPAWIVAGTRVCHANLNNSSAKATA